MPVKMVGRVMVWALLVAMGVYFGYLLPQLPASPEGAVLEANTSWAGVLRIWLCGGWSPGYGSFTPWLNGALVKFEKRNPGVYVQVTTVSQEALAGFLTDSANPPDAILFAPGMLESPKGLYIIEENANVRGDVRYAGVQNGDLYALPIAMGGYALAYNGAQLSEIPVSWRDLGAPKQQSGRGQSAVYWLNWPSDQPFISWSRALTSLLADRQIAEAEEGGGGKSAPPIGDGVDLGLPVETVAPDLMGGAPSVVTRTVKCALPEEVPDSFRAEEAVYGAFTRGDAVCIPVTQREIRRLQVLSETGKAPDWRVEAAGDGFTDQLLMMGIVDGGKADGAEREILLNRLLDHFLSEESQQSLTSIRAFPVVDGAPLYDRQAGMAQLGIFLRETRLEVPNAFDRSWRADAARAAEQWVAERR